MIDCEADAAGGCNILGIRYFLEVSIDRNRLCVVVYTLLENAITACHESTKAPKAISIDGVVETTEGAVAVDGANGAENCGEADGGRGRVATGCVGSKIAEREREGPEETVKIESSGEVEQEEASDNGTEPTDLVQT